MKLILAFLLLCSTALAQIPPSRMSDMLQVATRPAAAAPSGWGSPTNNTDGTVALAWYVASDFYTNTYVYLPDRGANAWHLTNQAASGKWPTYNATGLNGLPTLSFDGVDDYILSVVYTNYQPNEN